MVEKRRRDRMNNSLAQLKSLLAVNVKHNVSLSVCLSVCMYMYVCLSEQRSGTAQVPAGRQRQT